MAVNHEVGTILSLGGVGVSLDNDVSGQNADFAADGHVLSDAGSVNVAFNARVMLIQQRFIEGDGQTVG